MSNIFNENEQKIRRYIDQFGLGEREKSPNGVDRRVLDEKDLEKLDRIITMTRNGLTPKSVEKFLSEDLIIVKKNEMDEMKKFFNSTLQEQNQKMIQMENRFKEFEEQKMMQLTYQNEKTEIIEKLEQRLEEKIKEMEERKENNDNQNKKVSELEADLLKMQKKLAEIETKKPFWKFW